MQLQATDVRIGNWVLGSDGQPMQVSVGTLIELSTDASPLPRPKPIKITPSIFEGTEFKKDSEGVWTDGLIGWRLREAQLITGAADAYGDTATFNIECEFVHELQNLYWVAYDFKKELQINL